MGRSAREVCARELTLKEERGAMKKKIWLPLVLTLLLVGCGGEGEVAAPLPPESPTPVSVEAPPEAETLEAAQVESDARMPTEQEILGDYDRAVRIYGWFDLTPLEDSGETVTEDGTVYRRVSAAECRTMEELRLNLRSAFTEALTERLLSGEEGCIHYRDIDGALYVTGEGRERSYGSGAVTVEVEQTGETAYSVNVTVDLVEQEDGIVTGMECWSFPYVRENDRWGFSEFRLVY